MIVASIEAGGVIAGEIRLDPWPIPASIGAARRPGLAIRPWRLATTIAKATAIVSASLLLTPLALLVAPLLALLMLPAAVMAASTYRRARPTAHR